MLDTLLGFPLKLKKVAQWYFAVQHACRKPFYLDDYQLEWAQGPLALCMAGSRKPAWLCHWLQRMPSDYQALLPGSACCARRHFRTDTWSFVKSGGTHSNGAVSSPYGPADVEEAFPDRLESTGRY